MAKAQWGAEPEFFGPRHAHREGRILRALKKCRKTPSRLHLECAAGLGSLSSSLAREGATVVAVDLSLRSLLAIQARGTGGRILPVMADITALPFRDEYFETASSAETLEHIPDEDEFAAVQELARVLQAGGFLVGTVPAGPQQWSDWDVWADHQRRYTRQAMEELLRRGGFNLSVFVWGWPLLRLYDHFFLKRVNRRRLRNEGPADQDPGLKMVSRLGKRHLLIRLVRFLFKFDRIFDGLPWGVGLLFVGKKPDQVTAKLDRPSASVS